MYGKLSSLAICWLMLAPAHAALVVNENSSWPGSPIVAGASATQATTVYDLRYDRNLTQTFQVTENMYLDKAFIEYNEGVVGKQITLRIFKVANVNQTSTMPVPVGADLLNVDYVTSGAIVTSTTQSVMEFAFSDAHRVALEQSVGTEGYAFQILRTGTGSNSDVTGERAFKWSLNESPSVYAGGIGYRTGLITSTRDFSLALQGSPVPEPSAWAMLGLGSLGMLVGMRKHISRTRKLRNRSSAFVV